MNKRSGSELTDTVICGFHVELRIVEIEHLEDRDIPFSKVEVRPRITFLVRSSEADQRQQGVRRTLVSNGRALCPVNGIAQRMGAKSRHPKSPNKVYGAPVARKINQP